MMTLFYMARFSLGEERIFELHAITSSGIILMVIAGFTGGYLSDKWRTKKPFIITSAFLSGLCMCIYSISESIYLVIFISFVYQFVSGIFNSIDLALINEILPSKENYAKDIAIINSSTHIARAIISFSTPGILYLGGVLMNDDGYTLFFAILSVFSFLSAILIIPVSKTRKPRQ